MQPKNLIQNYTFFLIISNDFDESFYSVKGAPGFHYFDELTGLKLVNYEPSVIKRLARRSAFIRYLYIDLKLKTQLQRVFGSEVTTVDNKSNKSKEFLEIGRIANERFLRGITELSLTSKVIILLDGDYEAIYSGLDKRDINKPVNILFDELGMSAKFIPNVDVIDSTPTSSKATMYQTTKNLITIMISHWNEHGHAVAARALTDKIEALKF